jgi:hypothetical protein
MAFETNEQDTGTMGDTKMSPPDDATLITVPTFRHAGPTGRAAPASMQSTIEDSSAQEEAQQGQVINYYFPIEVEVIGSLNESHMQLVAEYIYNELTIALQS